MVKVIKKQILKASSIKDVSESFWDWFFSETDYGETNIIDAVAFDENDFESDKLEIIMKIANKYKKYANTESGMQYIEIENDLS